MKRMICLLAVCLMLAVMPVGVFEDGDVAAMLETLPTVEQFQAMDADAQLEAYNQVQAAYDAYMALGEEEKAAMEGAEESFEELFAHFNSLVMPLDQEAEAPAAQKDRTGTLLSGVAVLAVVILVLRFLGRKKA